MMTYTSCRAIFQIAILGLLCNVLSYASVLDFPKGCNYTTGSTTFICRGKGLKAVPTLPPGFLYIDLSHNAITDIKPHDFQNQSTLAHLDLSSNLIQNVSGANLKALSNLRWLNLSGNALATGIGLNGLNDLTTLDLSVNRLTKVPTLGGASLVTVNLTRNQISFKLLPVEPFDSSWSRSKNLSTLVLSHNQINDISSSTFDNVPPLKLLDLSHNPFRLTSPIDPSAFSRFAKSLETLNIGYASLTIDTVQKAFNGFSYPSLETLILEGNRLSDLTKDVFAKLANLRSLDMSHCSLSTWKRETFANLSLENIDLSDNKIASIGNTSSDNSFYRVESTLKKVKLSFNPFACNCDLVWLRTWMDSKPSTFDDVSHMICQTPPKLNGTRVSAFNMTGCHPYIPSTAVPTTTVAPNDTTTTIPDTTTTDSPNITTTAFPENMTTTAPENISTTAFPENMTTTAPENISTTAFPENITTTLPASTTTAPPKGRHGFPWYGVVLLILLFTGIGVGAYFLYRHWQRRRLLDEGRLPIIGEERA